MRILVVDDTEDARVLQRAILEAEGHVVVEAENGIKALDEVKLERPDLIISDILMPQMDGFAFCRALKLDPELGSIPFMFYTATYTEPKDKEFALSLGADRFVVKPAEPDVFLEIIKELLAGGNDRNTAPQLGLDDADQYLREYNVTLIRKLEKKLAELQATNLVLENEKKERKKAEEELAQSEKMFRSAFNQQFQFMAMLTPEGRVLEVNNLFLKAQDVTREECLEKYFWELPAWENLPDWQRRIRDLVIKATEQDSPACVM